MDRKIEIIPGIFEKDILKIQERIRLVESFVEWVQIDIADGKLVPNKTPFSPSDLAPIIKSPSVQFELHMMVEDPFATAEAWADAGFRRLLIHCEGIQQITNYELRITSIIKDLHERGIEIGLAVDKETSVDTIFPFLDDVDCVLVMTIAAGFSGQAFIPELLDKVKSLHLRKPVLPIEVDGGINFETARLAVLAGATRLVSTSTLFNSENIQQAIERLQKTSGQY